MFGSVHTLTDTIILLSGILPIELDYSYDGGDNWWFIKEVTIDENNEFQTTWDPKIPGEYIIRAVITENKYLSEFEAWSEPLSVGTIVYIDSYEVSNARCDVGSSQYVKVHACYAHSDADASNVVIVVNGSEYVSDDIGWIKIYTTNNTIGKSVWNIGLVKDVDGYSILIDNPTIIWDKIEILVESSQRLNVNSDDIEWSGKYLYNDEYFQGALIYNDTLLKQEVGRYSYSVMGIIDTKYDLESYSANDFEVIFDRVTLTVTLTDNRLDVGESPEISVIGVYEYDSQPFIGNIYLEDFPKNDVGKYNVLVESINDPLYGLTSFTQNDVTCIWDRVKVKEGGVSNSETAVKKSEKVWFKAEYEYNSEVFDSSKGILFMNDEPMEWSTTSMRWEKEYISDKPQTLSFEVTGIQDDKYGLKKFNDSVGSLSIEWKQQGIPGFSYESILLGLVIGIIAAWYTKLISR